MCVLERVCTYLTTEISATKISAHKFLVWCHGKVFEDAFSTLLDCNASSGGGGIASTAQVAASADYYMQS